MLSEFLKKVVALQPKTVQETIISEKIVNAVVVVSGCGESDLF